MRLLALALLALAGTAQALAQTTIANLPISCARANGLQANAAACTDAEQFQRPAQADDVVLACTKATACGWYDAELTWRKWSTVPATATVVVCPLVAAAGPMNCPGPQSPVWGGLTFVPKAQVAVAVAAVPPPTPGAARFVVTWTAPTTNTDGSAIGPILKTLIQVSTAADFQSWLQWENAGASTSYLLTNAPNDAALYWRAAVVTAAGQSAWSTPAVRTEAKFLESIAPPIAPWPLDDASVATRPYFDLRLRGGAMYYAYKGADGTWKDGGVWGEYKPDCIRQAFAAAASADAAAAKSALRDTWLQCIDAAKPAGDAEFRPIWEALRDANRPKPAPAWRVATNGTVLSRPAYALSNGSRTQTLAGRVAVGSVCDCAAFSSGTAPSRYCAVTGLPNIATADASDVVGPSAAICASP